MMIGLMRRMRLVDWLRVHFENGWCGMFVFCTPGRCSRFSWNCSSYCVLVSRFWTLVQAFLGCAARRYKGPDVDVSPTSEVGTKSSLYTLYVVIISRICGLSESLQKLYETTVLSSYSGLSSPRSYVCEEVGEKGSSEYTCTFHL